MAARRKKKAGGETNGSANDASKGRWVVEVLVRGTWTLSSRHQGKKQAVNQRRNLPRTMVSRVRSLTKAKKTPNKTSRGKTKSREAQSREFQPETDKLISQLVRGDCSLLEAKEKAEALKLADPSVDLPKLIHRIYVADRLFGVSRSSSGSISSRLWGRNAADK